MIANIRAGFRMLFEHARATAMESGAVRIGMMAVVVLLITILYPQGLTRNYEYPEGSIWNEDDLIAPFPFPIYRDGLIVAEEQDAASRATPLSFDRLDKAPSLFARDSLRSRLLSIIARIDARFPSPVRREAEPMLAAIADVLFRDDDRSPAPMGLNRNAWEWLVEIRYRELTQYRRADSLGEIGRLGGRIIDDVYKRGLLNREKRTIPQNRLALRTGIFEELVPVNTFLDRLDLASFVRETASTFNTTQTMREILATLVPPICKPNILYNDERTLIAVRAAVERVPRSDGLVKENERIVSRHERVTAVIKAKLDSYERASMERGGKINSILSFIGSAGHTIAILSFLMIYLFLFRKQIFFNNSRMLLLLLILLFVAVMSYLSFSIPLGGPVQYLILVPAAAMLYTIIFDSRVAFYGTVTISFLVGALRGNDYSIILASVLAGTLALDTVRDIKNRTQIFRSLAFIFLGYVFAITVDGLQRSLPFTEISAQYLYAFFNALLSPVVTFGLLVFFERGFGISTDLTLLELSDFNHPLLRELSARAPGTFHHSIVMGSLAESAAMAIGANAILARVGAYYHDIGKLSDPEYFVENQAGAINVHEQMEPSHSARIIINHVTEGIRLAKEYRLPQRVIDFIPAHHGTTLVTYFYEKQRLMDEDAIAPDSFRYGGPVPTTKETAIVMLADTIEAAARALEEPTVDTIEALIDDVIRQRLQQGQLEQCDLTFRDLTAVRKSFLGILTGIHHSRIKYPTEVEAHAARKAADRTRKMLNLPSTAEAILKRLRNINPPS